MDYLTVSEAAEALRISVPTVKRYIYEGKLQSAKLPGGQHRIPSKEIERLLTPEQATDLPEPTSEERIAVLEQWVTELQAEIERQAATSRVLSRYCQLANERDPGSAKTSEKGANRRILVLGPGCTKCELLHERTVQALATMGRADVVAECVKDLGEIAAFGPVITPALAIGGEVVVSGQVPAEDDLCEIIEQHLN